MVDFQGMSAVYLPGDSTADKRKEPVLTNQPAIPQQMALDSLQLLSRNEVPVSGQSVQTPSYSNTLHATIEPVKPPNSAMLQSKYGALLQNLPDHLERIISQVGSYFLSRRKNVTDTEELDKRRLNDFFSLDFLGERKVEPTHHSTSGENTD